LVNKGDGLLLIELFYWIVLRLRAFTICGKTKSHRRMKYGFCLWNMRLHFIPTESSNPDPEVMPQSEFKALCESQLPFRVMTG
jgi:hypothetical protein